MTRRTQISVGIAGVFLLLITLWPFVVMPGNMMQAMFSLFTENIAFGQRVAGILTTIFVIALFTFGFALLVHAIRGNSSKACREHTTVPISHQVWLRPGEQLFMRIIFFSFILGVINIASLFGSIIISASLFDIGPLSPEQILIQVPLATALTAGAFSFAACIMRQISRDCFTPQKVWELAVLYCLALFWLFILNIPIESYLSADLEGTALFQVFWPVLATLNVLTLLVVKMLFMKSSWKN